MDSGAQVRRRLGGCGGVLGQPEERLWRAPCPGGGVVSPSFLQPRGVRVPPPHDCGTEARQAGAGLPGSDLPSPVRVLACVTSAATPVLRSLGCPFPPRRAPRTSSSPAASTEVLAPWPGSRNSQRTCRPSEISLKRCEPGRPPPHPLGPSSAPGALVAPGVAELWPGREIGRRGGLRG